MPYHQRAVMVEKPEQVWQAQQLLKEDRMIPHPHFLPLEDLETGGWTGGTQTGPVVITENVELE